MRQVRCEVYITSQVRESRINVRVTMAATREAYLDVQQMCDYVLLKHVNVSKDAETEKLYKVYTESDKLVFPFIQCVILGLVQYLLDYYCYSHDSVNGQSPIRLSVSARHLRSPARVSPLTEATHARST